MADINDIKAATSTLEAAIDKLTTDLANSKGPDTQPEVDAINALTAKVEAIQVPA